MHDILIQFDSLKNVGNMIKSTNLGIKKLT